MRDEAVQILPELIMAEIEYPAADGRPMAETDTHRDLMVYLIEALKAYFQQRSDVYVAGNLFIYYEEGETTSRIAPDVFVVFGARAGRRRVYKLWAEGQTPAVVFEISSRGTRREDLWEKRGLYEFLQVAEYFLFDPLREYLKPPLQGYRLVQGQYQAMSATQDEQGEWQLFSQQLGLELRSEGEFLYLYTAVGERLLTPLEAQNRVYEEAERRRQAEAQIARLEAELARLRGNG